MDKLDEKTQTRFGWSFEQLAVRNIRMREPLAKHLEGALWELRERSHTDAYRIIYFFFTGRRIILLHGFEKKSQKTPRGDLAIARDRHRTFVARERGRSRS